MANEVKRKYWQPWDEDQEKRWDYLCQKEENGSLSELEKKELETLYDELDSLEFTVLQPSLARMTEQVAKLRKASMQMQYENGWLLELSKNRSETLYAAESRVEMLQSEYELLKKKYARLTMEKMKVKH